MPSLTSERQARGWEGAQVLTNMFFLKKNIRILMGNPCLLRQVRQRRPQLLRLCPLRVHALRGVRQKVLDTQKIFS